ncbi:hypothetical protein FB464_2101 [Subtercola boreus]|nr:hypothetical protein FB464_2101 [Subtercola boreus]
MRIHHSRLLRTALIVAVAGLAVTGCTFTGSSDGDNGRTGGQTGDQGGNGNAGGNNAVIAPVIADLASIDGSTVTVPLDNVVVLESGDVKVTVWTGSVSDPKVAEFVAGKDDGSATFNPGIQPLAVGGTSVSVTDSDTGEVLTFDLEVTP